jgi:hypothetical protein
MADIERGTNPGSFRWQAPTENTDGSPITEALNYNLYRADDADGLAAAPVYYAVVGELQSEGVYEAPLNDFPEGRHVIALTAVDEGGDESALSNSLGFTIARVPEAPVLLAS